MAADKPRMSLGAIGRRTSVTVSNIDKKKYVMSTERCGDLHVFVQGDIAMQEKRAVFLAVHDLGCNHQSFHEFFNHPSMIEIRDRSIFILIDVPGNEDLAEPLPDSFQFPSLQTLGEDLVTVLNFLHVKYVICLGQGAGANVCARFAIAHPTRVLGMILINCITSAAGAMDTFKNKVSNTPSQEVIRWNASYAAPTLLGGGLVSKNLILPSYSQLLLLFVNWRGKNLVSQSAEDYLLFHKFGHVSVSEDESQMTNDNQKDRDRVMAEFQSRIRSTINSRNLKLYVNAFLTRKDLPLKSATTDMLLVTGTQSPYVSIIEKIYQEMADKNKCTLLKVDKAGDVLLDAPAKVAQAILLFCKGLGLLTSLTLPGVDKPRSTSISQQGASQEGETPARKLSRGMSMEEYDKPNIRRLSVTAAINAAST